ncbi:MAG: PTS glucose transporter subunit IIA [Clostridiales bacterium]|jgi:glucose-specific phosphotransferase system IIA component|nr:PTS glucose transporter subunit IIA [Clostridiales bacterium]
MGFFTRKDKTEKILAPQSGKAVSITEVPDPVFSGKVIGDGVGIQPNSGEVFAPVSGTVVQVAHTLHAIGLESDDGVEVLVHLGIDTVKLKGEGFTCHVKEGQHVNAGDKLMDMDLDLIADRGFSTVSPCIITNLDSVKDLQIFPGDAVAGETAVITYRK